jgi:hypothetical protein
MKLMPGGAGGRTRFRNKRLPARHQRPVVAADAGIDNMIDHREHARRIEQLAALGLQRVQGGGTGPFMQEDPVDGDQGRAAGEVRNQVGVPDLLEQGARTGQDAVSAICAS